MFRFKDFLKCYNKCMPKINKDIVIEDNLIDVIMSLRDLSIFEAFCGDSIKCNQVAGTSVTNSDSDEDEWIDYSEVNNSILMQNRTIEYICKKDKGDWKDNGETYLNQYFSEWNNPKELVSSNCDFDEITPSAYRYYRHKTKAELLLISKKHKYSKKILKGLSDLELMLFLVYLEKL